MEISNSTFVDNWTKDYWEYHNYQTECYIWGIIPKDFDEWKKDRDKYYKKLLQDLTDDLTALN